MIVTEEQMKETLLILFQNFGFQKAQAKILAETHTQSTMDGVFSHGINRVPRFIEYLEGKLVNVDVEATLESSIGAIERWDGQFASGVLNALKCTERAIDLAKANGIGLVALKNTNHWMRGGTYGQLAAEKGCAAIMFTNTQANMPPWGGRESKIGNNPFIVALPRSPTNVVLDMALSQFSFGKIDEYRRNGKQLPFVGGYDKEGNLSNDPNQILEIERGLPIGYWKGSALSMVLDMLATVLSGGQSTSKISRQAIETGISQVFICIEMGKFVETDLQDRMINEIIQFTKDVERLHPDRPIRFPGERSASLRKRHRNEGMEVNDEVWNKIRNLTYSQK